MENLKNIKLYLLDMDGTIYLDDNLFDGVIDFLKHIKAIGGRYMFLTNNSSKSVDKYIKKLDKLGIAATAEDFLTSVDATIFYLKPKKYKKIYALGTKSFKSQLIQEGLNITDTLEDDIDCLCMGFDTELAFQKIEDACILLGRDIDYIATNPDLVCPTWYGSVPDCGSVSEMLYNATGKKPFFIGKPNSLMVDLAVEKTGFAREQTALIGDRLYTDIACATNAQVKGIFVLSGEGTKDDIQKYGVKPDYIYKDIKTLLNDLTR
ncbi:MAG: HAD-IIA family hydrolase [Clostridia bacterium]|nr:HAD-IIA family hydrolase [Clostridia bacterium]